MTRYNKPFLNIEKQLGLFEKRGLIIKDKDKAKFFLEHINYYHLSAYAKTYQNELNNFKKETSFEDIISIYEFDQKLRLLLLGLLDKIEISFRSVLSYKLTKQKDDIYWYIKKENFSKDEILENFRDKLKKRKEKLIQNFYKKYDENEYPPVWIFFETLSFGECRHLAKLLYDPDKQIIASVYKFSQRETVQMFYYMVHLRNICAHHSWLWNRRFSVKIGKIKKYGTLFTKDKNQLFDYLLVLQMLLSRISPEFEWLEKLEKLIKQYSIPLYRMGFPDDWKDKLFNTLKENNYE